MATISLPINDRTFIATRAGAVLVALALPLLAADAHAQDPPPADTPAAPEDDMTAPADDTSVGTGAGVSATASPGDVTYVERESTVIIQGDDDDDKDDKRFRLHIDSEVLGGAWFNPDGEGNSSVSLGFGLARPSLLDGNGTVMMRPLIGLGMGYVFAENRAVVGAKVGFTVDAYDLEHSSRLVTVGGRLVPYFHWMFLPDRRIRPYFEARVGFGGSTSTARNRGGEDGRVTRSFIYPVVGGGLGLHMFPRDYFSVDLGLNIDYAAPYGMTRRSEGDDDDWDKVGDVVNYGVLLGVSTWF